MDDNEPITYSFKRQLAIGLAGEAILDKYFSDQYLITSAKKSEQKVGIDRRFQHKVTGTKITIEYKTDYQAQKTGNAFVETTSFSRQEHQVLGWAYTCKADWIVYFCYHLNKAYLVDPIYLRNILRVWELLYPEKRILNEGWIIAGIPVPLCKFRLAAIRVLRIGA